MCDSALSSHHLPPRADPFRVIVDITIVVAASAVAWFLEDLASTRGWIAIGPEARGVSPVIAGAIAAISVTLARGGTLADLGFRRPERWSRVFLQAAGILIAFIAAQQLLPLLVSAFITLPEPDMSRYAAIAGNPAAAIILALLLPLTASIPEEIIYRGFLIGRLSELFGTGIRGAVLSVLIQALIFSAVHFMWGVGGMILTLMMGIIWGSAYLLCGRNLWVVILAHSAGHVLFVVQLYLGEPIAV